MRNSVNLSTSNGMDKIVNRYFNLGYSNEKNH